MIQFNLLPDIKLEYIRARRVKQTVVMVSTLVGGAALFLLVVFILIVNVYQKQKMSSLNDQIASGKKTLQEKPDLSKILTIQNQLNSLPDLHKNKPVASRVFTYIQQVVPQNASVATLTVNFDDQTMKIEGSADSLATVNTFADTLKFTNFTTVQNGAVAADAKQTAAFSGVVLSDFSFTTANKKDKTKPAKYTIAFKYDKAIFSSSNDIQLVVASKVTTRSETEKPETLFQNNVQNPGVPQ